jgi:hypothetical protein
MHSLDYHANSVPQNNVMMSYYGTYFISTCAVTEHVPHISAVNYHPLPAARLLFLIA